jgi:hypothetical protein
VRRLLFAFLGLLLALIKWLDRNEAVRLNLQRMDMAKIGQSFQYKIAPTNAAGAPAPVSDILWGEDGDSYDLSVAPDGLTVTVVANSAGLGNVLFVSATTKGGLELRESITLEDVESPVDEEAVALNLSIA